MGGLVLDVIIIYLVRRAMYRWRRFKGNKWPSVDAILTESDLQKEYGYTNLHLSFRYRNESGRFEHADYYIPYWYESSASEEWKRLRPEMEVRIRTNPADPAQVILSGSSLP